MKFIHLLGRVSLLSIALAGIIAITYSQEATVQAQSQSPAVVQQADSIAPGVSEFLRNPTQYGFACGEALGEVTGTFLDGSVMVIEYTYPAKDEIRIGQLVGEVDSDGLFTGTYNTNSRLGLLQGDIAFTFAEDGTADGSYGNGTGTAQIFL
ncbi:MAG: hypothetical protein AAFN42_08255 [Cyanobacteria bacterium J06554_1]